MVEKSCCAAERFPDCRSLASCWKAWAIGLLLCGDAAEVACGEFFSKVAKSDCAADRFPADKSFPNCWISCCNCCFLLVALAESRRSKRLVLEIPETDIKLSLFPERARKRPFEFSLCYRSAVATITLVPFRRSRQYPSKIRAKPSEIRSFVQSQCRRRRPPHARPSRNPQLIRMP